MRMAVVALLVGLALAVPAYALPTSPQQNPGGGASAPPAGGAVRVVGTVIDQQAAIPLPGVPVEVVGTGHVVYTDVDGRYVLSLPRGTHQLKVLLDGYQEKTITVEVAGSRTMTVNVPMAMHAYAETITVIGQSVDAITSSAAAQLTERMNANVITDNMGASEMRQNADSDAAGAMARVTGISVVDNSYVYVRGLGERYSNTTLNGATLPTTEPDKKVVPLDLFPTGLLDSVQVVKSYQPDRSAEFAGGLVQIQPLKFPTGRSFSGGYSYSSNSLTRGKSGLDYAGGGRDGWGYDDGTRSLPAGFPNRRVIRGGIYTPDVGFLHSELETMGELFPNVWDLSPADGKGGQSWNLTFGDRWGKLGVLAGYNQNYKEQIHDETQTFYRASGNQLETFSDYDFQYTTRKANVGAVGNVAYQFTGNHRVAFENFYSHSGKDEARYFEGFNSDINTDIRNQRLFWIEEGLLSNQLSGNHFFPGLGNSIIDWRFTYSKADRDEPDVREVLYERNGSVFVLADESQSGFRMFNALDDRTYDGGVNGAILSKMAGQPVQYKFGGGYTERARDFSSRRFRFQPIRRGPDLTQAAGQIFTAANIGPYWEIKEETRTTDTYDARLTTGFGYGMIDWALGTRSRLVGGLRVEAFNQTVNTFDLFDVDLDDERNTITAENKNTDVFPAVNYIYAITGRQNVRFGFSQTTNRPEFRELAPFEFTDIVGGRAVVGNPDLKRALIQNVDFRWELFPGAEQVLSASVFFKNFQDPIEKIIEPTAQLRTSFTNAEGARNFGFEVEARKLFGRYFLVGGNYTFVDSKVTLTPQAAQVQTSLERPLAGQSKNVFNGLFEVRGDWGAVRLLYNYFDKRISDVGSLGLPDIYEDGRSTVDLVFVAKWKQLNFKVAAENLGDEAYLFTQGEKVQREFTFGRTIQFGVGFDVF
ncbi:MAG: carboxypeptidase-like regulatory domain-containing protein [Acidobacteriota bacterium]